MGTKLALVPIVPVSLENAAFVTSHGTLCTGVGGGGSSGSGHGQWVLGPMLGSQAQEVGVATF